MITLEEIHNRLVDLGEDWADKHAAAQVLEGTAKSVLAQIAMKHVSTGSSAAQAKLRAECDPEYVDHIKAMVEARKAANLAKVHFEMAKTNIDLLRTKEASRRAELKTLGG